MLLLHYILEKYIVRFTPLHLSDSNSYNSKTDFVVSKTKDYYSLIKLNLFFKTDINTCYGLAFVEEGSPITQIPPV